jgi:hypothetical protein
MARPAVRQQSGRHIITQKFYVYDPGVNAGDELGGLRVREDDKDDKGKYVLASPLQIQWWIDQGLLGDKPFGEVSASQKKLVAQVTRGRSESDEEPKRVPKYSKLAQSGTPGFALSQHRAPSARAKQRAKDAKAAGKKPDAKKPAEPPKRPQTPPA